MQVSQRNKASLYDKIIKSKQLPILKHDLHPRQLDLSISGLDLVVYGLHQQFVCGNQ